GPPPAADTRWAAAAAKPIVADGLLRRSNEDVANAQLAYKSLPPPALAAPAPPGPTPAPKDTVFGALADNSKKSKAAGVPDVQRFYRLGLRPDTATGFDKAANVKGVLASFQVEQRGREVRIVDSDGSIYSGS